jgi:ferredoxin
MNISTGRLFSSNGRTVQITYIDQGGKEHSVNAEIGKSLMDIAHDNNIELEGKCSIQRMFS